MFNDTFCTNISVDELHLNDQTDNIDNGFSATELRSFALTELHIFSKTSL